MLTKICTSLCLSAASACLVAWLVALLHEHGFRPVCSLLEFFRKQSKFGRLVFSALFLGLLVYAANKPDAGGNDTDGDSEDIDELTNVQQNVGFDLGMTISTDGMQSAVSPLTIARATTVDDGVLLLPLTIDEKTEASALKGTQAATRAVRQLTDDDFRRGFVLTRIATGESFDFSPPSNATVCADWRAFGAAEDWTYLECGVLSAECGVLTNALDRLRVYSFGKVDVLVTNETGRIVPGTWFAPFRASLGIVPEANWNLLDANSSTNSSFITHPSSLFWSSTTPSNTLQLTWQNVLLNRETNSPVSFQAELWPSGKFIYRYDLSQCGVRDATALPNGVVSNILVGASSGGNSWTTNALPTNVTSMVFHPLTAEDAADPDRDGDGISTVDELFVHGTDPGNADTDFDGLSDSDELTLYNTDPLDPHARSATLCDGYAVKIGDIDPFSCPEGSTNTVLEHVFYSGTTNGVFAYPQSDAETAVLRVSVSGTGSGELIVGDRVVPLLVPTSDTPTLPVVGDGDESAVVPTNTLLLAVGKGVRKRIWFRKSDGLDLALDSDDLLIGELPVVPFVPGWIAFPHTDATAACIHDLNARGRAIGLVHGEEFAGLSATWTSCSIDVMVSNTPPVSAMVYGCFQKNQTRTISYAVHHPLQKNKADLVLSQTVRFCPNVKGDAEDPDDVGCSSTSDYEDDPCDDSWCWCSVGCEGCGCPCHYYDDVTSSPCDPDDCPIHDCPYEECASQHRADYVSATNVTEALDVLKLHAPLYDSDIRSIVVDVPEGWRNCCPCPEHRTNYVAMAYKDRRVNVHLDGEPFAWTAEDCTLDVYGASPSDDFDDATVSLCKTGTVYLTRNFTVFGVDIVHDSLDLRRFNDLSRSFGLPTTVCTNLDYAETLKLRTDVNLPEGDIHLAFEDATSRMQLWMAKRDGYSHLILDSETCPTLDMSLAQWKHFTAYATDSRDTSVRLLTYGEGKARLFFGYAAAHGDAGYRDEAEQTISVIRPPILPDYNRDGSAGLRDAFDYRAGRTLYFWTNDDTWKDDDAFSAYGEGFHPRPFTLPSNGADLVVNGRNDLVNLCPLTVDISRLSRAWTSKGVTFEFLTGDPVAVRHVPVRVKWNRLSEMITTDQVTLDGTALHEATLSTNAVTEGGREVGYAIPPGFRDLANLGRGALALEFVRPGCRELTLRAKDADGATLSEFRVHAQVLDVHDMYRWINLEGECGATANEKYATKRTVKWPDGEHADANVIFVHGYNMHPSEAWDWSQAMFKRLWWSGADAGFTAVLWRGNETQVWVPGLNAYVTKNYHQNVLNAFRTAAGLSREAATLPGARKYFIAHSLGNMLVSAARQFHSLTYDKYLMLNAAVPLEAYDAEGGVTDDSLHCMTPSGWRAYPARVRAAHWYELFGEGDARHALTWKGLFKDVDDTVNFYSSMDEVVANGDGAKKKLLSRKYAWYKQELAKGSHMVDLIPEAGWGYGRNAYTYGVVSHSHGEPVYGMRLKTVAEVQNISTNDLKTCPFFRDFAESDIYGENGSSFVQNRDSFRWRVLSHGIPAESFATGANHVPKWGMESNVDMSVQCKPDLRSSERVIWVHSYFVGMPLKSTFRLFEKLVSFIGSAHQEEEEE